MADTFILWLQNFLTSISEAGVWLVSKPFANVTGMPSNIQQLTPLALIGLSGLMVFVLVAVVKWVIS